MARCNACGKPGVPFGTICAECEAFLETRRQVVVMEEEEKEENTGITGLIKQPQEEVIHPVGSFLNVPRDAYITSHMDKWGQRR